MRVASIPKTIEEVLSSLNVMHENFAVNSSNGVVAVCLNRDFFMAHREYMARVGKSIPTTEIVKVIVPSVVTYAESDATFRPIHTGIAGRGLANLVDMVLRRRFWGPIHFDANPELNHRQIEKVAAKIFRIEKRLYVPFATDSYQLVWQMFSAFTPEEAEQRLLVGMSHSMED